jgi:peptide/nickel transport system substrate-binding protein
MTDKTKSNQGLSRRELLQAIGTVGAFTGLGGGLIQPNSVFAGLPTPRRGGRIRVAGLSSSTADTLDPAKGALSTDYTRHYMIYSGLTQFDSALNPLPALAESFSSEDQQVWIFNLRNGVQFHDGKSFTADDVVYSLMRHKDPATASKMAAVAAQIESVRALTPNQVEVRLQGPNADFAIFFATSHLLIIPDGTVDFIKGTGCGPYKLKEFIPGVRTIVVRNETYWKPGQPYLDEIELIAISDEMARVNALLSGDVQLVIAVDPRSVRRIHASGRADVLETTSSLYTNLIMRQDQFPGSNHDFALAIKYLFDRETIKRSVFRGSGMIGNDHPVAPNSKYYAADLPVRAHDLERAAWHLKRSGVGKGPFPMFAAPIATGSVDMAALLQMSAQKVGLNLRVNRVPSDGYWSNHWMKHPITFGNINPRPSLDLLLSSFFVSNAPWNETGWSNEKLDQLVVAARGEGNEDKRKQMYVDVQTIIHEHCPLSIPNFISFIDGFDKRLGGMGAIPIGGLMGYSFAENVWWNG